LSPIALFNKTDHSQWCQLCTDWKLGVQPSVAVGPAPNSGLAPDEKLPDSDDDDESENEETPHDDDGTSTVYETGVSYAFHFGNHDILRSNDIIAC
jgi:hypothetical protein